MDETAVAPSANPADTATSGRWRNASMVSRVLLVGSIALVCLALPLLNWISDLPSGTANNTCSDVSRDSHLTLAVMLPEAALALAGLGLCFVGWRRPGLSRVFSGVAATLCCIVLVLALWTGVAGGMHGICDF